jgi:hypothetical protein
MPKIAIRGFPMTLSSYTIGLANLFSREICRPRKRAAKVGSSQCGGFLFASPGNLIIRGCTSRLPAQARVLSERHLRQYRHAQTGLLISIYRMRRAAFAHRQASHNPHPQHQARRPIPCNSFYDQRQIDDRSLDRYPDDQGLRPLAGDDAGIGDYASTEKIAYLPQKLSPKGARAGVDPDVGDIAKSATMALIKDNLLRLTVFGPSELVTPSCQPSKRLFSLSSFPASAKHVTPAV